MIEHIKNFYRRKPWTGRFIVSFFILSLLLISIRIALSPGIIYGATSWLKKQGIDSSIEAVDINILDGTVTLRNARGSKAGKALFEIGLVGIHWQWQPLSNKVIDITEVALDSFSVNIKQYSDTLIIGGVSIPLGETTKTLETTNNDKANEEIKAWAASLGEVTFTNLNICYLQDSVTLSKSSDKTKRLDYCTQLEKMSWAGTISYATDTELLNSNDIPLTSTGNFTLNGLSITDNRLHKKLLISKSNTLSKVTINGLNKIHLDQLEMKGLSLLQRDDKHHIDSLRFQRLSINDIQLSELQTLSIGNITIDKPGTYLVKPSKSDWEYQQWLPQTTSLKQTINKEPREKSTVKNAVFKFTLNNLNINNADLCYLDNNSSLYYCFTFAGLDWKGKINYDSTPAKDDSINILAQGDLKLSQPNIHNQTINRNLLNFETLTLTKLNVTNSNAISIQNLKLENLDALQRSDKDKDNTLSFNNLAIDNIKYTDQEIAINTITLKGLANTISKNKDGHWEYDKWLTNNKLEQTNETSVSKNEKPSSSTKKSFILSVNSLDVSTDEQITFTDNSTRPAMKLGLNSLTVNVGNIDTNKPDSNSTFKLYAKTTRHGTINIKGTAKPFAKKISFDASGKLKGFDLRAATPATRKAIGHIIQSGQLDADLKLLAVDGVLDSNIALSLYQFKIKAVDKESAKKLDAKFGMPLNQTLVLLRDKDDSIHLDIPITGDVTNPNFNPMDAIIKATSKAATVTLITFYTPYGLVYAGGNLAFNLATALNFDPVEFAPGSAEISSSAKQQLDGLTKLLSEKPQVHLTLCGVTNRQDTFTLFPELKEKPADKTEIKLTDKQLLQLNQLARDRQINSKNYLVKQRGIEHDRLILCAPEHKSDDDAIAGVEIVI